MGCPAPEGFHSAKVFVAGLFAAVAFSSAPLNAQVPENRAASGSRAGSIRINSGTSRPSVGHYGAERVSGASTQTPLVNDRSASTVRNNPSHGSVNPRFRGNLSDRAVALPGASGYHTRELRPGAEARAGAANGVADRIHQSSRRQNPINSAIGFPEPDDSDKSSFWSTPLRDGSGNLSFSGEGDELWHSGEAQRTIHSSDSMNTQQRVLTGVSAGSAQTPSGSASHQPCPFTSQCQSPIVSNPPIQSGNRPPFAGSGAGWSPNSGYGAWQSGHYGPSSCYHYFCGPQFGYGWPQYGNGYAPWSSGYSLDDSYDDDGSGLGYFSAGPRSLDAPAQSPSDFQDTPETDQDESATDQSEAETGTSVWQNPPQADSSNLNSQSTPAGSGAISTSPLADTVLYLNDGASYLMKNYWVFDNRLHYITSYGAEDAVDVSELNLQRTVDENSARGVTFTLKPAPGTDQRPSPSSEPQN